MRNTRTRRFIGASSVLGIAVAMFISSAPATATEIPEETVVETEMTFAGFDAEVAAEYGYAIRTIDGYEWSVPSSNAEGDTTNGVQGRPIAGDGVQARNTVAGLCGRSSLYYTGNFYNEFVTSYSIFTNYGAPVAHTWRVASATSSNLYMWNLDGLAPWGQQGWSATRNLSTESGSPVSIIVVSGTVTTNNGTVCTSGGPSDYR